MEKFTELVNKIHPLSEEELQILLRSGEDMVIAKGTDIVTEGTVNRSLYFVKEGVLRGYRKGPERDTTIWFSVKGETVFSSWGYVEGKPSQISVTASCDCSLFRITFEESEKLFTASAGLSTWGRKLFERLLLAGDQWMLDMSSPLAAERYLTLAKKMPEILQNVPLKEIAEYLWMTPQSLSRIRARLIKEK